MARLPAGRHGLSRSFVAENQRLRLLAAMLRLLPEHGYPALTIGQVTAEAGVSRAAFYAQFSGKEESFLATYDVASRWLCEGVEAAVAGAEGWRNRVEGGAVALLRMLAANPRIAHLLAIESYRAGEAARGRQEELLDRFAVALREGNPRQAEVPDEVADLLVGGVVTLVARYVVGGRAKQLPGATSTLAEYLVKPYLGSEA